MEIQYSLVLLLKFPEEKEQHFYNKFLWDQVHTYIAKPDEYEDFDILGRHIDIQSLGFQLHLFFIKIFIF